MKRANNYGGGPEAVYEILKRRIISGALQAGAELKLLPLARAMNISTIPLREAIRMLAAERLVRLRPRRSPVVAEMDVRDLVEINQIRAALEPVILADAVARHTPATLARCEAILKRTENLTDPWEMVELNKLFHLALLGPSRLQRSLDIVAGQYDGIARLSQYRVTAHGGLLGKLHSEHASIFAAVRAGKAADAVARMERHIGSATVRAAAELSHETASSRAPTAALATQT